MKYDVVIPLSNGSRWDNNELRYCLRSLEKYFKPLGEIYIMTPVDLPWLQNVNVIYVDDPLKSNKDGNLINKVVKACEIEELSDQFLRLSDDQLLLSTIDDISEVKPFFLSNLKEETQRWWSGKWKQRMKRTMDYLTLHELPTFHYDAHCPLLYDKQSFLEVWSNVDFKSDIGYCINTFYFNHLNPSNKERIRGVKAVVEADLPVEKIRNRLKDKLYLGYSDAGLTKSFKAILAELFPEKSKFEI